MASLDEEVYATRPSEGPASMVVFDLDHFKVVNETHGNVCGDQVLAEVARVLWARCRPADVLARYGGEEFAVLMPGVSAEEAASVVESMRQGIEACRFTAGGHALRVTASAGIASTATPGADTAEGHLRLADEALFAAKAAGRNCVRTWQPVCRDAQEEARRRNDMVENLQTEITALSLQSKETFVQSTHGLVQALEARDPYTKSHSVNVTRYAVAIAETMHLAAEEVAVIRSAAIVHDIGKIGVPDAILRKPGALTPDEQRIMAEHVVIGARILGRMRFLEHEIPIVHHHHERWDGRGYPDGLAREAIPLGARVLAVADTLDAITSDRPYRAARPLWQAVQILLEQSGSQFDPEVVDALVEWLVRVGHRVGNGRDLETSDLVQSPETSQAGVLVTALG
jgi:diguanylate cyclase (GGDEF)-like protein/putative nucleotidyltransferase with HDIG domain